MGIHMQGVEDKVLENGVTQVTWNVDKTDGVCKDYIHTQ